MSADFAVRATYQLLWTCLLVAGPILVATLVVGLVVSAFQVVTQIQEMSLSYVPKLVVAGVIIATGSSWMLDRLVGFASSLFRLIPNLG